MSSDSLDPGVASMLTQSSGGAVNAPVKQYPEAPRALKMAREFVTGFKSRTGYELADEFEDDLTNELEKFLEKIESLPGFERGEPMAWRR